MISGAFGSGNWLNSQTEDILRLHIIYIVKALVPFAGAAVFAGKGNQQAVPLIIL